MAHYPCRRCKPACPSGVVSSSRPFSHLALCPVGRRCRRRCSVGSRQVIFVVADVGTVGRPRRTCSPALAYPPRRLHLGTWCCVCCPPDRLKCWACMEICSPPIEPGVLVPTKRERMRYTAVVDHSPGRYSSMIRAAYPFSSTQSCHLCGQGRLRRQAAKTVPFTDPTLGF